MEKQPSSRGWKGDCQNAGPPSGEWWGCQTTSRWGRWDWQNILTVPCRFQRPLTGLWEDGEVETFMDLQSPGMTAFLYKEMCCMCVCFTQVPLSCQTPPPKPMTDLLTFEEAFAINPNSIHKIEIRPSWRPALFSKVVCLRKTVGWV